MLAAGAVLCVGAVPFARTQDRDAQPSAHKTVIDRLRAISRLPTFEWRIHAGDLSDGQSTRVDDSSWQVVKTGYVWTSGTLWFRHVLEIPPASSGYDYTGATLWLSFSAESDTDIPSIIYINGSRVAMGVKLEPIEIANNVRPGQRILIAAKVIALPGKEITFADGNVMMSPATGRPDPWMTAQALQANEALEPVFPAPSASVGSSGTSLMDRGAAIAIIDGAYTTVDFTALGRGDQSAFDASLTAATQKLSALDPVLKKYSVRAVGNSHIDMAWLWPWSETTMVVHDTFGTALQLMNEYPDYTFTQSTAQASAWMEEKYPDIFAEIKKRVAEGRWELVGGMWVEPDLNMPDGESQVRQLLLGKRYFKEKFGKDIRIGWNPDSFGYNWQLPQIYRKSGIDYFVTQKISWNDTTQFPYKLFWWQSPDGSRILTYFPHDYVNTLDPVKIARDAADLFPRVPNLDEMMHLYGIGDHGGGPTRFMLDEGNRWRNPAQPFPRLFFGTAQGFFDDLEKEMPRLNLPTWNSELYLQYHRGVFTSQAETKRHNRESEVLLLNAEKFASLAYLTGADYPSEQLNYAWKKVLFNQFHDVAAGSGISAVYRDADRDYAEVRRISEESIRNSLGKLTASMDTTGPGVSVVVLNSLAWERTDIVEVKAQMAKARPRYVNVVDSAGHAVPSEIDNFDPQTGEVTVLFLARNVPSLGYEIYHIVQVDKSKVPTLPTILHAEEGNLENEYLTVKVDQKSGCITSLVLKKDNYESIEPGSCGNLLQAFQDKPKDYDAWNIDADFEKVHWDLTDAPNVTLVENGPVRAEIRISRKFRDSMIYQDVTVYAGIPRVDIETYAEWHEKHILLKAAFPVTARSNMTTYEIPFGSIERPTTRNTKEEQAMFEVPAIRWADMSDTAHGFSLLNNCKYGYDAKDNVLRISLLRSPESPDPHADEGSHHFIYSLYPHDGDWKQAQTVRRGYELNYRLISAPVQTHAGSLNAHYSYFSFSTPNVVLTALKRSEDNDSFILRFYEWAGQEADVAIDLPFPPAKVYLTNLMEQTERELPLTGSRVIVHTRPFEIQTIKVVSVKVDVGALDSAKVAKSQ